MISLLIHATAKNSGKTLLALGMGLKFRAYGYTWGYLKPVGWIPEQNHDEIADRDAIFMKKALDLKEPLEEICPVVMTQDMIQSSYEGQGQDVAKKILDTFRSVHQNKDILIVEGAGSLFEGLSSAREELNWRWPWMRRSSSSIFIGMGLPRSILSWMSRSWQGIGS